MMNTKTKVITLVILALILFSAMTIFFFRQYFKNPHLPIYGKIQAFELIDTEGKMFHSKELNGKIWIANFIFTTCGDICPIMTKNMSSLSRTFDQMPEVNFVSISVNPEQDTPDVLKTYAQSFKADLNKWHFLTGKREDIKNISVNQFKVGSVEEPIFHSTYFILIDHEHQIRGYYDGTRTQNINKLFLDTATLRKQMR